MILEKRIGIEEDMNIDLEFENLNFSRFERIFSEFGIFILDLPYRLEIYSDEISER